MATRKQSEALAEQRTRAAELSAWREGIVAALEKAKAKRAKKRGQRKPDGKRGIDRVPKHLRGLAVQPKVLVEHTDTAYADRRRWARNTGRKLPMSANTPVRNQFKDRSLSGKARVEARRAARRRTWFFKGHGMAGANDFNLRYNCHAPGCGHTTFAPLDDFDFMTDVMDHEATHEVAW